MTHEAVSTLLRRFGKRIPRINAHILATLDLPRPSKKLSVEDLRSMTDTMVTNIRSLKNMGVINEGNEEVSAILGPIIYSRLPEDLCQKWCELHADEDGIVLDQMLKFIERHVESLEMARISRGVLLPPKKNVLVNFSANAFSAQEPKFVNRNRKFGSTSNPRFQKPKSNPNFSLDMGNEPSNPKPELSNGKPPCPFCSENHYPGRCELAKQASPSEVLAKIKNSNRCHCCLNFGHHTNACNFKPSCSLCKGKHNVDHLPKA